ncbi:MAG: alpha/beta hydrolase [Planctomycetota bacterium]
MLIAGIVIAGIALAFIALRPVLERYLTYFPSRRLETTPEEAGLAYENVAFPAADGTSLHGWFVPHPSARATILFSHGNAGNISHRLDKLRILHGRGCSVFLYDHRGYGKSEGTPSESGLYADGEGAWRWLVETRKIAPGEIVLYGESLGTGVVVDLATKFPAGGIIVESGFSSFRKLAREAYPLLGRIASNRFDNLDKIRKIAVPKLVIHAERDGLVPIAHAEALFAAAREPKAILRLPRGGHNDGFLMSESEYGSGLDKFLSSLPGGAR